MRLSPSGHLLLTRDADAPALGVDFQTGLMDAFALGSGHGLLYLGAVQVATVLPPVFAWWRDFAARYVTAVCGLGEGAELSIAIPSMAVLDALTADVPPMRGAEYLTDLVLATLWSETGDAFKAELAAEKMPLADFLKKPSSGLESGRSGVL